MHRRKLGRNEKPSFGIIDSQSAKTQYAAEERGYDGGKKIKGRKRHIVVDILGNLLHVKVHAANIHDTKASCNIFTEVSKKYPSIIKHENMFFPVLKERSLSLLRSNAEWYDPVKESAANTVFFVSAENNAASKKDIETGYKIPQQQKNYGAAERFVM